MRSRSNIKLIVLGLMVLFAIIAIVGCGGGTKSEPEPQVSENNKEPEKEAQKPEITRVRMTGVVQSSTSYPMMATIGKVLKEQMGVDVSIEGSAGGVQNTGLLQSGQADFAGAGNHSVYQAFRGIGEFADKKPYDKLRGWFPLYKLAWQIIVKSDSGINTWEDLKGKKINVGVKGGSAEKMLEAPWAAAGLTRDKDYKPYFMENREGMEALQMGTVDATLVVGPPPHSSIIEFQDAMPIRVLSLSQEVIDTIREISPYYAPTIIPAGLYKGQKEDALTGSYYTIMLASKDLPEDFVYEATKAIMENWDEFTKSQEAAKTAHNPEGIKNGVADILTMHPGAEKYFKEIGWLD